MDHSSGQFPQARFRGTGAAVLALLLYLLLLDSAVETFLGGSPLRWTAGGVVLAYLGSSVLLWRRVGWAAKASSSLLVLLGILVITAWQPGGLSGGLVLLGQPTPTVLAAVTALAVLWSGVVLVRERGFPVPLRAAIAALVAYASCALVAGIAAGTPYADLFHGRSAWERLPFWLQGAFVGALVLAPLAWVVDLIRSLAPAGRGALPWSGVRLASLGLCIALAAAGLRAPADAVTAHFVLRPFLTEPALDRSAYLDGARRLLESSGMRTADIGAAARAIGSDPGAMLAFVRSFAFDPYRGSQRGPLGTLMAQAGNALDRSLLMASLLRSHGYRTRLVHGRLADDEARRLLDLARVPPAARPWAARPMSAEEAARISGLPVDELASLQQAVATKNQELGKKLAGRVQRDVVFLQHHLEAAGVRLKPAAGPTLEDVRSHVWVQVDAGGEWRDLDSLAPEGRPEGRIADIEGEITSDPLPEAWVQTLGLRLVASYRRDDTLREEEVLKATLRVPDLVGRWILLGFPPQDGGEPPLPESANAFRATMVVGDRQYRGSTVYLDASRARAKGPAGLFGAVTGSDTPQPLESLRMEFALSAPGMENVRIARTIVRAPADAADPAVRIEQARMQLVSLYAFVAAAGPMSTEWLASLLLATQSRPEAEPQGVVPLDLLHLVNAMTSPELGESVGQPQGLRSYYSHPLLLGQRFRFRKRADGQWAMVLSVDLLHNRSEFLTGDPLAAVRRGVLDTHLERLLFDGLEVANTTVVFERSRARVAVLRPGESRGLGALRLGQQVRARIEEDLAAGYAVVVPAEGVRISGEATTGWWRIRPDGEALGRMESGEGQGLTEKIILSLPSAYALGAGLLCPKEGLTKGICDACYIMLAGALGVLLGFAGIVYVLAGDASYGLWVLFRLSGGGGVGLKMVKCLESLFGSYTGGRR